MKPEFEAIAHGEAWRWFCKHMTGHQYGPSEQREAWLHFLAGWKAKAKQHDGFFGNRR